MLDVGAGGGADHVSAEGDWLNVERVGVER
jgi:hypothetical protein